MDLRATTPEDRFVWVKLKYLGCIPASFLWLSLAVELTEKKHWLKTWQYQLLWIPAIGLMLTVFTNEYHEWFWEPREIKPGETHSGRAKGPGFQFFVFCTSMLALFNVAQIVLHSTKTVSFYRRRNLWLLLSFLSPYIGYWLHPSISVPWLARFDPVILMLVPSSIFMAIAMFRYQAMDIVPIAQKMVFDSVHSAVIVIDPEHQVVATNSYARTLWPNTNRDAEITTVIGELDRQGLADGAEIELQLSSNKRWYLVIVSELASKREGHLGHSLVFVDITERREQEQERLEVMNARSRFIASVSHELRSPLHAMRGLLDMTMDDSLSVTQQRNLRDVKASTDMLLALINNVLDESRLQADKMPIAAEPVDLDAIVRQLKSVHGYSAEKKGITLKFNTPQLHSEILGDAFRLTQVIANLLANAIRFTERGQVSVAIRLRHEADAQVTLDFEVADTGIGISKEDAVLIFKPFHQSEHSSSRESGGTGLGLAIAQALVLRMGGKIGLSSQLGQGSTFSFSLDFDKADAVPSPENHPEPVPKLSGFRVLVVDDSQINLDIVAAQLQPTGVHLDAALDGAAACERAAKTQYDLVLLDVHMPRFSGLEVAGHIKALAGYQQVPVVAMSASVLPEDRKAARGAGFDGFLDKPFSANDLFNLCRRYLLEENTPGVARYGGESASFAIVDSDKAIAGMNGNKPRYMALLKSLVRESETQTKRLRTCDNADERRHVLHQLVGAAKLLRADGLARAGEQAESQLNLGGTALELEQELDQLQEQTAHLKAWIAGQS